MLWSIIVMKYLDTQLSHGLGANQYLFFFMVMYML